MRHEARSKSERRAVLPERRRSQEASSEVATAFRDVGTAHSRARDTAAPQRNSARTQETQQNKKNDRSRMHQSSRISRRLRNNDTTKLANRPDRENSIYQDRDENHHFMKVDTAREQRDRHFSRAREGRVACDRETSPHRQQNASL